MKDVTRLLVGSCVAGGVLSVQQAEGADFGPYVKAEAGYSKARSANFRDDSPNSPNCVLQANSGPCSGELNHLGSGWNLGVGVGYKFPGGFRAGVSYNRRAGYDLKGSDPAGTDFDPEVKSNAVMLNGAFDLPINLGPVKPFVGAGIGRSRNEMKPLKWNDPGCCSGTLTGGKKTDTAWEVTLGADIEVSKGWTLELMYRYMDMGKFVKDSGPDQAGLFGTGVTSSATGKLRSNEIIVGFKFPFSL